MSSISARVGGSLVKGVSSVLTTLLFALLAFVTVVIAAEGYPASPRTGDVIEGLAEAADQVGVDVFHAGTTVTDDGEIASAGGRVLSVTAHGETLARAREHAYAAVDLIRLQGSHHRRDIAKRAADEMGG